MTDGPTVLQQEPLYAKLRRRLQELIQSGPLKPGDRLPSEHRLADEYAVSRATVREAVRALTADGLLIVRQGRGTFVALRPPIDSGLEELDTVTGMIERHGYRSGATDIHVAVEAAGAALADRLGVPAGTPLVQVERIRTADGDPVVLSRNSFPRTLIDDVPTPETLGGSLLAFLERHSGLRVVHAVTTLRPLSAGARLARRMRVRRGTPFFLFEQVHYAQNGTPCLYCEDYYRSDAFRFRILRRRRAP